jgi:hypothetical protein
MHTYSCEQLKSRVSKVGRRDGKKAAGKVNTAESRRQSTKVGQQKRASERVKAPQLAAQTGN